MDLLAHVETFVTVADERSFTRAAQRLELPQPLLSRRIKALERSWGGALFDRAPRRLELTALGELALPYARDVLHRTRHLRDAVAAARTSVVQVLGVPPGCSASALAAVIRAGAAHGVPIAVHEEPAAARRDALRDGRCAAAVIRVPVGSAGLRVLCGLAHVDPRPDPRPIHLDALRPRRGTGLRPVPMVRLSPEDDLEPFAAALRRAAARAGVAETGIRGVESVGAGAAAVLADGGWLVCEERSARLHGLGWAPFADAALHRGYELVLGAGSGLGRGTHRWLEPLVGAAVGAEGPAAATGVPDEAPERGAEDRLAARGS